MRIEVTEDKISPGDWRVEIFDTGGDGECFVAIFVGSSAMERAQEYANWKRQRLAQ